MSVLFFHFIPFCYKKPSPAKRACLSLDIAYLEDMIVYDIGASRRFLNFSIKLLKVIEKSTETKYALPFLKFVMALKKNKTKLKNAYVKNAKQENRRSPTCAV